MAGNMGEEILAPMAQGVGAELHEAISVVSLLFRHLESEPLRPPHAPTPHSNIERQNRSERLVAWKRNELCESRRESAVSGRNMLMEATS